MGTKEKIYENVLKACEEEYKDKISAFNQLDIKAQQVAAFSGVLLGVLISFCKKELLEFLSTISLWCIIFSLISIIFLLISICFSIFSMRIIKIIGMPTYDEIKSKFKDLCELHENEFQDEYYQLFISDKITMWEEAFISISVANEKKAKYVFVSQIMCGSGLIILGLIGIFILTSYLSS